MLALLSSAVAAVVKKVQHLLRPQCPLSLFYARTNTDTISELVHATRVRAVASFVAAELVQDVLKIQLQFAVFRCYKFSRLAGKSVSKNDLFMPSKALNLNSINQSRYKFSQNSGTLLIPWLQHDKTLRSNS